jgi:hypothetical protein
LIQSVSLTQCSTEKEIIKLNVTLLKQVSATKARIRFAVIDSGIGIQEKNKNKILKLSLRKTVQQQEIWRNRVGANNFK